MRISKRLMYVFTIFLAGNFYGCLKDKISAPVEAPLRHSGEILFFLEEKGDYINSTEMPSLVDVDEVYTNSGDYLILDIRSVSKFSSGHIQDAINRQPSEVISYLDSIDYSIYPKIVIISQNGQSSAYYTCLLRLYGFSNIYSMNFGMAAWNQVFSDEWLNARAIDRDLLRLYTDYVVPKPQFTPLPQLEISGSSLEDAVKKRIKSLMDIDFTDSLIERENNGVINYHWLMSNSDDYLIVCYDTLRLYKDVLDGIFHPSGAVSFHPAPHSDLASSEYLQSIPSDKKSAFYSANGQLSAFVVAYLRLLGYDAKSILFGSNNMYYDLLYNSPLFSDEAFSEEQIKNYPFVTGN